MADNTGAADRNAEIWKIKTLIKSVEAARGNGTIAKMLADEFGTASNIKSRVNRLSVLGAITSVEQTLKLYNKVPPGGLVVTVEQSKRKSILTLNLSNQLIRHRICFGFTVIGGSGASFGTRHGNTREVLHKFASALRFAHFRLETPHNYARKVAETAVQLFISGDKVIVAGLVLAGSTDFKTELSQSDMFDQRLQWKVLKLVDISYGAMELSSEVFSNMKFIQEKKLIGLYFDEISQDTGTYCFEILIVCENLDIIRYVLHCQGTEEEKILYLTPEQEKDKCPFTDKETREKHELIESMPLLEWFPNNYKKFGATLEIVTDKSQEGSQFVTGFDVIGGILRCRVDFEVMEYQGRDDEFFDLDGY
uniref:Eukaryotic peptide chain release factor subunit 1 n=1 Tax=Cebus imitator TaxID=2715852 RepID=A0A2K5QEL7_CEBIM